MTSSETILYGPDPPQRSVRRGICILLFLVSSLLLPQAPHARRAAFLVRLASLELSDRDLELFVFKLLFPGEQL